MIRHRMFQGTVVLSIALLMLCLPTLSGSAQQGGTITGTGLLTATNNPTQIFLEMTFPPIGGPVNGELNGQRSVPNPPSTDCTETFAGSIVGNFAGADGGAVTGTLDVDYSFVCANGRSDQEFSGNWNGSIYADGHGSGTWNAGSSSGTWYISFSAADFQAGLATTTPTITVTPIFTATPTLTPNPTALAAFQKFIASMAGYQQYLLSQIARLQEVADSPYETFNTYVVVPWADYRLARLVLDENGNPLAQDEFLVQVPIQQDGTALTSTDEFSASLQEMFQSHPEIDWLAEIQGFGDYASGLLQRLSDPTFETTSGTADSPQLTDEFVDILKALSEPSLTYLTGLDEVERQILQRQLLAVMTSDPLPRYSLYFPPDMGRAAEHYRAEDLYWLTSKMYNILKEDDELDPELRAQMQNALDTLIMLPANTQEDVNIYATLIDRLLVSHTVDQIEQSRSQERWSAFNKVMVKVGHTGVNELVQEGRITQEMADDFHKRITNRWPPESVESYDLVDAYNSMLALRKQQTPPSGPDPSWFTTQALNGFNHILRNRQETNLSIFIAESY